MMLTAGENFYQQICTILNSFSPLKSIAFYCIGHADSRHLTVQHKACSVLLATQPVGKALSVMDTMWHRNVSNEQKHQEVHSSAQNES